MIETEEMVTPKFIASQMPRVTPVAAKIIGSEILKIAADIRAMVADGKKICNLTVGDFNSKYFPIPEFLEQEIDNALKAGETNYPPSDGILALRKAVQSFYKRRLNLDYPIESFIITGGARPVIYGTYNSLVAPGDTVVYPVPSWNNNHYCGLHSAIAKPVITSPEDSFMPTREKLKGTLKGARMLSLNSPLNPAGTMFTREQLEGICDLVLEENASRKPGERPLFLMYDQVYWMLTFGGREHVNPVSLRPEMAQYTVFVDGISKAFASTGLRVGWAVAPPDIAATMSNILGHVGAWAPRPEQVATAELLLRDDVMDAYHATMFTEVEARLRGLYDGIMDMRDAGLSVNAIPPMGAIYLSAQFDLVGKVTPNGKKLSTTEEIRKYLLEAAGFAIVPFYAFDLREETGWCRLSVGATSVAEIDAVMPKVRAAVEQLR
ncbi:MAG TPA: aminotransferase class I/II-fold pyridoxal phosphate-dependent enzyme [Candidatus Kapabacteria bacterium]|nr:aminotransferase class I/II-fold pyridoxal phosphate-dependent enzyme [Candidatus Kapabacteria bacterium]